jgi:hypothetical protein
MQYDTKDERCIAAHDAGERTARALMNMQHKFSPEYLAMAIVQDALMEFCKPRADSSSTMTETKP